MASYVQNSLVHDETILHEGSLSAWPYALKILAVVILIPVYIGCLIIYQDSVSLWQYDLRILVAILSIPVLIGILILIDLRVKFKSTELAVTNRRVIAKFGFIRRRTFELNIDRVEAIQVEQGIWGRIFGFGTLRIAGAGNFDPIPNISSPMAFKKAVMESQEASRMTLARP
jgi:membrane protein YdbS with pleckstrin-like domain